MREKGQKNLRLLKKGVAAKAQVVQNQGHSEPDKKSPVTNQPQNLDKERDSLLPGVKVLAAPAALEAEAKRLKLWSEIPEKLLLAKELGKYDRRIAKCISKLLPTIDNVRWFPYAETEIAKTRLLRELHLLVVISFFLVTSQFTDAMDYILAEFNRVCIYTVPKYLQPSDASVKTKEYYKMIGYYEEDGKLESTEAYLTYVSAYVKLYAAIVQSEIEGMNKPYGFGTKANAEAVTNLEFYITEQLYVKEPEGRHLATGLLSRDLTI